MSTLAASSSSSWARRAIAKAMRRLARAALVALCISVACATVVVGRYLLFEYRHGDGQLLLRLLDILSPLVGLSVQGGQS